MAVYIKVKKHRLKLIQQTQVSPIDSNQSHRLQIVQSFTCQSIQPNHFLARAFSPIIYSLDHLVNYLLARASSPIIYSLEHLAQSFTHQIIQSNHLFTNNCTSYDQQDIAYDTIIIQSLASQTHINQETIDPKAYWISPVIGLNSLNTTHIIMCAIIKQTSN